MLASRQQVWHTTAMHRLASFLLLTFCLGASAENWPRFRGPSGQGLSSETSLPIRWSATENVRWKTPVAGEGWSSPVVWNDHVFVTTVTEGQSSARVIALDRRTGKVRWDTPVTEIVPLRKESKNSYASPTPVTDGEAVYVVFGDGTMAALNFDGKMLWKNQDVKFYSRHGLGASPVLHEGLLIMPFDGSNRVDASGTWPNVSDEERLGWQIPWDRSEVVAVDARTGRRAWATRRGKSRIAHVTPVIVKHDGVTELISPAGDAIQGFNPKTGELLWNVYSQGEGVTPSPAFAEGLLFTASGFEKTTLRTVKLGGRGDVTATHVAWEQRKGTPNQPSLIHVNGLLYSVTDGGIVHCFQPATGEIVYAERVGGNHSASPVYADGHLYFLSETGEAVVVKAGPEFRIVSRNPIDERCQASIAISQGNLFLRSERHVFCVGP